MGRISRAASFTWKGIKSTPSTVKNIGHRINLHYHLRTRAAAAIEGRFSNRAELEAGLKPRLQTIIDAQPAEPVGNGDSAYRAAGYDPVDLQLNLDLWVKNTLDMRDKSQPGG